MNWKFKLSTGDTIYCATRAEARATARWYRTYTDPSVRTSSIVHNV